MRIKVEFTIDVNPEAWEEEYGISSADFRADVKKHAQSSVVEQFNSVGVLAR